MHFTLQNSLSSLQSNSIISPMRWGENTQLDFQVCSMGGQMKYLKDCLIISDDVMITHLPFCW